MYVDSDYEINTGELPEVFFAHDKALRDDDKAALDEFSDSLNDWD